MIVYVYTDHVDQSSGKRQSGSKNMFDALSSQYHLLDSWSINRPKDILHDPWPDMTSSIEETRITKIYIKNMFQLSRISDPVSSLIYDWEKELQMALLAIEAKQNLRSRGIRV